MIDRKLIIAGIALTTGGLLTGIGIGRATAVYPGPDQKHFKESMRDRYKHVAELKLKGDAKEEAFERVRDGIKRDIRVMFDKEHQITLTDYSDKLWSEFYSKVEEK